MKKTELLIPVGNYECLLSAIHNGADAVYLGGKKFGARAYSDNFNDEEMIASIKLCHLYNVKIYVTVNTMIYNDEIKEVLEYLSFLYENNVDAVIMQDIGLINLTRKLLPNLEIHISTQAHNHNEYGIQYYKDLGIKRVVFDRESSLEEITNINIDIEREVFVYGALCISYSGNCLFSALNGSRSANRGMCVGSCRLPYQLEIDGKITDEGYLLSTKDLNTTTKLEYLLNNNIESLKVEGRMKGPEYVAQVTKIYRRLIDSYYNNNYEPITEEELLNLSKVYNREYTTGYLFNNTNIINKKTSNHQGIKIGKITSGDNKKIRIELTEDLHQEDAIRIANTNIGMYLNTLYNKNGLLVSNVKKGNICEIDNKERILVKDYIGKEILKTIDYLLNKELLNYEEKKISITMEFNGTIGKKARLIIKDETNVIEIPGPVIELAKTNGVSKEKIIEQLNKLGNTPFITNDIKVNIDDKIFINFKDINEMRRNGVERLIKVREGIPKPKEYYTLPKNINTSSKPSISILTRTKEQLELALRNNIDVIYTTNEKIYNEYKINKNVYLRLDRVIHTFKDYHNERLLCTELGSIYKYYQDNDIISDYYLNIANDYSISSLKKLNIKRTTLSVELDIPKLQNIENKANSELIVYGYPECMIIKNDILNSKGKKAYLINKQGSKFKVESDDNFTHIFNQKPINLIDKIDKLKGFSSYRIELLDENIATTQTIINKLKNML